MCCHNSFPVAVWVRSLFSYDYQLRVVHASKSQPHSLAYGPLLHLESQQQWVQVKSLSHGISLTQQEQVIHFYVFKGWNSQGYSPHLKVLILRHTCNILCPMWYSILSGDKDMAIYRAQYSVTDPNTDFFSFLNLGSIFIGEMRN